jgi:hypothetical protein
VVGAGGSNPIRWSGKKSRRAGKNSTHSKLSRVAHFELEKGSPLLLPIAIVRQQPLNSLNGIEVFEDKVGHHHQPTRSGNQCKDHSARLQKLIDERPRHRTSIAKSIRKAHLAK